jgi:DHA2 family methylenomycin A resistance protein-like MFS transporter
MTDSPTTILPAALAVPEPVATEAADVRSRAALGAAVLGFFIITLDAVIVNVALPAMRTDRVGARRAFGVGLVLFAAASAACGLAPNLAALVGARFVQGTAAAMMMPSSMALIGQAYPDKIQRARAIAIWALGGSVASSCGPVLGGLLTLASWRWIFLVNVPVVALALLLLSRTARSPRRTVPFDWTGQVTAVIAMGGLTYGAIEAGSAGFSSPPVLAAFAVAVLASAAFLAAQARGVHPMVPLDLFRSRPVDVSIGVGVAFVVGYYGLPFVMSLYLQQLRGLSALGTGLVFLPMMLVGLILTPFSARLAERLGARRLVSAGLLSMTSGLAALGLVAPTAPVWVMAALMGVVGLAGPLVMPPVTAVLLNAVPAQRAGTASGVFNASRQTGGALAVAVFGALLAAPAGFVHGLRLSLLIAAAVALAAAAVGSRLLDQQTTHP